MKFLNLFKRKTITAIESKKTSEVFLANGLPEYTFVERRAIRRILDEYCGLKNRVILFLGYSKSGKTVYRKKYFENENDYETCIYRCSCSSTIDQLYSQVEQRFSIPCKTAEGSSSSSHINGEAGGNLSVPGVGMSYKMQTGLSDNHSTSREYQRLKVDVNYICNYLCNKDSKVIILEDYHLVSSEFNSKFSEDLKHFIDENILFVIIGIPSSPNRCFKHNPDLAGRSETISFDYLEESEIKEMIQKGEECLNVRFSDKVTDEIIKKSYKNAYLVQSICCELLKTLEILETQKHTKKITDVNLIDTSCKIVSKKLNSEYKSIIQIIVEGARSQRKDKVFNQYEEIIKSIKNSTIENLEKGLSYAEISRKTLDSFSVSTITHLVENKKYKSEETFRNSVRGQISSALNNLEKNFDRAKARKIILIEDKKLYLMDILFKFYLTWSDL